MTATSVRPAASVFSPKNKLLKALPAVELARLRPLLKRVELPFGQVISEPGQAVLGLIFPEDGIASLLVVMKNGDSIEVAVVGCEGVVGIPTLFGARKSPHRVIIQQAGYGYQLTNGALKKAREGDGILMEALLRFAYTLSLEMAQTAACNRMHEAEERLARWLLLVDDRTESDKLSLTHEFLSQMLGTRRSTVTIVAGILQKAGLIEHHRGSIRILDRSGLERASCECYSLMRDNARST